MSSGHSGGPAGGKSSLSVGCPSRVRLIVELAVGLAVRLAVGATERLVVGSIVGLVVGPMVGLLVVGSKEVGKDVLADGSLVGKFNGLLVGSSLQNASCSQGTTIRHEHDSRIGSLSGKH